jgi:CheY-like chemotaxis protein
MAKVLLVGYIRELLEERKNVLHAAGHHATMAATQQAAYQAIEQDTFDVAVLGFSVPEQERNEIARRLTQGKSNTRIVMIYFTSVQNTELADALIPTTANAQDVLRAVNHVLKTQKSSKTS